MPTRYSRYITLFSIVGDFLLLNLFFVIGYCSTTSLKACTEPMYILFYLYLNACWFVLIFVFGAHKINRNTKKKSILFSYIRIIVFYFFFFLMFFQLTPFDYYPREFIRYLFPLFFLSLMVLKFGLYYAFLLYRKKGFNFRNVIILGYSKSTKQLASYFNTNKWHGYRFMGFFDEKSGLDTDIIGDFTDLKSFLDNNQTHEIYIAWDKLPAEIMTDVIKTISEYPVNVRIVPDLGTLTYKTASLANYETIPVIHIHPGPLSYWYNKLIKRGFDVLLSLLVIVTVLSWMTPLLYLFSFFGSREGVFFKQKRTALDGSEFVCLKYRSMHKNHEADEIQATENDDRVTSVGRYLRKYSMDELPQFLNVLAGHMSVVGPRPHMLKHTEEYRSMVKRFMLRHTVRPGITGLAQVNGFRGEIKCNEDIENRVKFDVRYIENWSFNLDIKIIFITIWLIIRGKLWAY